MFKIKSRVQVTKITKESGQALLFVIVAMTVALAVGVNVSLRTLSSVSRTSQADTSERVLAAAEGGAEAFLKLSVGDLKTLSDAYSNGTINNATCQLAGNSVAYDSSVGKCRISYPGVGSDNVDARAYVEVEGYPTGSGEKGYTFNLEQDSVTEVVVSSGSVALCFTLEEGQGDLYYIFYGGNILREKGGIHLTNPEIPSPYSATGFTTVNYGTCADSRGFDCCRNVTVPTASEAMRIRAIGGDMKAGVFSDTLPLQGYLITSTGELVQDGVIKISKEVSAFKSYPYLPVMFDFGIFSSAQGWDVP